MEGLVRVDKEDWFLFEMKSIKLRRRACAKLMWVFRFQDEKVKYGKIVEAFSEINKRGFKIR